MSQATLFNHLQMPKSNTEKRNQALKDEFKKMDSRKYTLEYRLEVVAKKFFLNPLTAYRIIKGVGHYAN